MIYRGTWNNITTYAVGDLVLYQYKFYLAKAINTNSTPPSADWKIFTVIQSIAYLIQNFIALDSTRIWIYNQDYKTPTDPDLFIVLEFKGSLDYSSTNRRTGSVGAMQEEISVLTKETYTINVMSKNDQARLNQQRVRAALTSTLAQQQQEIFQYRIGEVSKTIVNLSELEGSGMYNRFAFDVSVDTWFAEDRAIDYFDQFSKEILTDNTE